MLRYGIPISPLGRVCVPRVASSCRCLSTLLKRVILSRLRQLCGMALPLPRPSTRRPVYCPEDPPREDDMYIAATVTLDRETFKNSLLESTNRCLRRACKDLADEGRNLSTRTQKLMQELTDTKKELADTKEELADAKRARNNSIVTERCLRRRLGDETRRYSR